MFIRKTQTRNAATGEAYFTHRLVRGERIGNKVRQITVLNLGRHLSIKQEDWPVLCSRLEQLLHPSQSSFLVECSPLIERAAQHYAGQLIARAPETGNAPSAQTTEAPLACDAPDLQPEADFQEVDIHSLQLTQPRSVGVEYLGLHALSQVGLLEKLVELNLNGTVRAAIIGNLLGRMAHPASEIATWRWLQEQSALGELLEVDFTTMSHRALYRASDALLRHRKVLEDYLFNTAKNLFTLEETVTLYDLTNTYFEGEAAGIPSAAFGRSKEKRSDCPLVTLGLVLDGSGFVRRSRTFKGSVSEGTTLPEMLEELGAGAGAMVIMDAGIAIEANMTWLVEHGYRYLVVRRAGAREFESAEAETLETASGATIRLNRTLSEDGSEVRLHCHSEGREVKERAMSKQFGERYLAGLQKIVDGLQKPRAEKRKDKLLVRLGRLQQQSKGASQHYAVTLSTEETGKLVTGVTWEKVPVAGTMETHPGVYCLRSNALDWDAEKLWRSYTMLTDLESVFRSLKSELGLRPIYHSTQARVEGHLFITVLAYQLVQVLRTQLKKAGIQDSWATLRETLSVQRRVTVSMRRRDGHTVHVRKSTVAEPDLMKIYAALKLNPLPGGTKKRLG